MVYDSLGKQADTSSERLSIMLLIWSLDFIYLEIVLWMVVFLVYFVSSYCFIWSEVVNIKWPLNRMIWMYWILISFFYRERFLPSSCTNKQFVVLFRICLERTYFVKNENWKLRLIYTLYYYLRGFFCLDSSFFMPKMPSSYSQVFN